MSLPQAAKNVSENPPAHAVTDPTNKQVMQADVDRKMRLWGVITAFRNGRMPTNQQIDDTLNYTRDHSFVDVSKLSPEGRKLTEDTRALIETARLMVQEKNGDEMLQNFVYHTSDASFNPRTADVPLTQDEIKNHGSQAAHHLRTLLQLLLTNSEARKLLADSTLIGRDLFAQGAAAAAERMRPSADKMAGVDDAAPAQQWTEQQQLDGDHMAAGKGLLNHLKDTHRDLAQPSEAAQRAQTDTSATGVPTSTGPLQPTAGAFAYPTTAGATLPQGPTSAPAPTLAPAPAPAPVAGPTSTTAPAPVPGELPQKKTTFFGRFQGKVPQEHRDRAAAEYQGVKNKLSEQFPEERRDQWIYRLKKVVVECQSHPQYKAAIEWFLATLEQYFGHAKNATQDQAGHASNLFDNDPALQRTVTEMRTLAERFANNTSLDGVIAAVQRMWQDAREDEELRNWWERVDKVVRKTLLEPGFILQPQFNSEWQTLQDQSHVFFDERYKDHKDALFSAVGGWFTAFGEDPLNKRFGEDWSRLARHLLLDDSGQLTFKPRLWTDVRTIIAPTIAENVGYIPIPRIEYTDPALDLVLENLTLQGRNLFPNIIELQAHNYFKLSPYGSIQDVSRHTFTLSLSQIQADLRDVAFYFHKKSGFPRIRDSGLADVFVGGQGITARVKLSNADASDQGRVFVIKEINVKVDALRFAIKDAKHGTLYKTLRPLATGLIKKQISRALGDALRTGLELVDAQLVQVRDRMAAAEGARASALELKNIFSKRSGDGSESSPSTKASKRESRFKIVPRRESMLLPEHGHETGWSKLQAKREDMATQGEGWRSDAFSIVPNASTTAGPTTGTTNGSTTSRAPMTATA